MKTRHTILCLRLVLGLFVGLLVSGCASVDTPSPAKRLSVTGNKRPLKVGVILSQALERLQYTTRAKDVKIEQCSRAPCPKTLVDTPVTIKVGQSSVDLFRTMFPQLFETVDFLHSATGNLAEYQLVFIPRLSHFDASHDIVEVSSPLCLGEGLKTKTPAASAQVTYEIVVKDRQGTVLLTVSETGRGHAKSPVLGCLSAGPVDASRLAFEAAAAQAFAGLSRKVGESPAYQSFLQAEAERQARPATLVTEVQFDDSRAFFPNSRLDASEEAELLVTLRNQGTGAAYGVVLAVSADQRQVITPGPQELGEIPPGQSREVCLPIKAGLDLPNGTANLFIEAREKRGYDARKVKLVLPTAHLEKPSLVIVDYVINDGTTGLARGNGNGIPETGETVELLVLVKNVGPGAAAGTTLSLATMDPGIEVIQKDAALGVILPDQTSRGTLAVAIPRTYTGSALHLGLRVSDGRGEMVGSAAKQVALAFTARAPVLALATRILSQGREVRELTNSQTVEVEVTPRNTGTLDAEQVVLRVRADQPGVMLQRDRVEVGALKAGVAGPPQRFELTVPRGFVHDRLPLTVELSQRGFMGQAERLELSVKVRRPILAPTFIILGRHGGRAIEQNEMADLEVRIRNTGDLPAQDVQARIDVTAPGVEVQGPKSVGVGTIPPNDQGVSRFRLRLLRSVPPGELLIALTVAQADFPALADTLRLEVRPEQVREERVVAALPPSAPIQRRQPPIITLASPRDGQFVQGERLELVGSVVDEQGIQRVLVTVNDKPVPDEIVRQGLQRRPGTTGSLRDRAELSVPVALDLGRNTVTVTVYNRDNEREQISRTVTRLEGSQTSGTQLSLLPLADVDRHILALGSGRTDQRRWAVIIGIEQYRKAPPVVFASRDVAAMREYAVKLLGVPPEHVMLLLDDQATKSAIQVVLEDRLQQQVQPGDTVFVYFAGHGMPEAGDGTPYLLPADGDPQSLRFSAYSTTDFYTALGKLKAERVVVFLDACFSGLSARQDQPRMLFEGARPGVLIVKDPILASPRLVSFAAAQNNQLSNAYKEQAHGLFTYFLLKGLSGDADQNGDGNLKLSELAGYIADQVSLTSRRLFGQTLHQTPVVKPALDPSRDVVVRGK